MAWMGEPRAVGDLVHVEKFFARNLGGLIRGRQGMPVRRNPRPYRDGCIVAVRAPLAVRERRCRCPAPPLPDQQNRIAFIVSMGNANPSALGNGELTMSRMHF